MRKGHSRRFTNADKTLSSCAGAGTSPKSQANHLPVSIVRLQQHMTKGNEMVAETWERERESEREREREREKEEEEDKEEEEGPNSEMVTCPP